jgi:uncharacterized membrane protein/protein-disulfide isomerase
MIAFGISCYLAFAALTSTDVAGCGGGRYFDCSHVLQSKFSKWMGLPVSLLAAANYLVMLLALTCICLNGATDRIRRCCWAMVSCSGLAAGLAAIWFIYLQAFPIGHFCPWCLVAHGCGLVIAAALLWKRPLGNTLTWMTSLAAAAGIGVLILGQVLAEDPPSYKIIEHPAADSPAAGNNQHSTPVESGDEFFAPPLQEDGNMFEAPIDDGSVRRLPAANSSLLASLSGVFSLSAVLSCTPQQESSGEQSSGDQKSDGNDHEDRRTIAIQGNLRLDPRQWPLLGSAEARYIFVEMFDYACSHCRNTHRAIRGACDIMGEDLALIVLPVPLNTNCNNQITRTGASFMESCELSRLAVACWRVDPEKFQTFHHWMFEGASCPSYAQAKARVDELVGREAIDEELRKETASKYIAKHVQLYQRAGKGVIPKMLFPTSTVEGEYSSASGLVNLIRQRAR